MFIMIFGTDFTSTSPSLIENLNEAGRAGITGVSQHAQPKIEYFYY